MLTVIHSTGMLTWHSGRNSCFYAFDLPNPNMLSAIEFKNAKKNTNQNEELNLST